jgi:protein-tyrosine-phosphatase/DNA-binding HxlR family transcriptional regulator
MAPDDLAERRRRAAIFGALADPTRLWIIDLLTLGDLSSTEIQLALDMPSNLVAHHVNALEKVGAVSRTPSEKDKRRSYIRIAPEAFHALEPAPIGTPARVVFVSTANSVRSQLAEAIWRTISTVPVLSAGIGPAASIHPLTLSTAQAHGLEIGQVSAPRSADGSLRPDDFIVSVCDGAHEDLDGRDAVHWSIPDPARIATAAAFETTLTALTERITVLHQRFAG